MSLISVYAPPLDAPKAAHLLRRATFGATATQTGQLAGLTAEVAVERLLANPPPPQPPIDPVTKKTFVDQPFSDADQGKWQGYVKGWWTAQMVNQPVSLTEKMALFWQNHFVVAFSAVNDSRYMYRYLSLLRTNALGNFKSLLTEITKDPAMLRYLNGNSNVVGKANENYARELQELFAIGGGNYTEADVRTAARVLTGWRDTGYRNTQQADIKTEFRASQHDTTDKIFSASYQNAVIKGRTGATAGDAELNDLLDMILRQPEAARFVCRKLYRWFVNYDITPDIERNFIEPLAQIFRQGNYEIRPVVAALLKSTHFYDNNLRGCIIKSPLELTVGALRHFAVPVPDMTQQTAAFYEYTANIVRRTKEQQMDVLDQPTVFGYAPYFETDYYKVWINSTTLALRSLFTDTLVNGTAKAGGKPITFDSVELVRRLPAPADLVKLMDDLTATLFAVDLTRKQKDFLIDQVLIPGLPRYEWATEWNAFTSDAGNTSKRMAVKLKLDALMRYLLRMAEYQMC